MKNYNSIKYRQLKMALFFTITIITITSFINLAINQQTSYPSHQVKSSDPEWAAIRLDGKRIGLYMPSVDNCDNITVKYPAVISALETRGANVTEITTAMLPVDAGLLANYDVVWFDEADGGAKLSSSELSAISTWVTNGGGSLSLGDESSSPAEDVSDYLGPYWTSFYSDTGVISGTDIKTHEITQNVTQIYTSGHTWMPTATSNGAVLVIDYSNDEICSALEQGTGNAVFLCDDDIFTNYASNDNAIFINNIFGWLAYRNANAPSLSSGMVSPSSGTQTSTYNFSVTYTDIDNNEPASMQVSINGTVFPMSKATPLDYDYTDGAMYFYQTDLLQPGNYTFHFSCNDGSFSTDSIDYSGPSVTYSSDYSPTLSSAQVNPSIDNEEATYNFSVWYYDDDNNYPSNLNVTINTTTTYNMSESDPNDVDVKDGKQYYYLESSLPIGYHSFQIRADDGTYATQTSWINGPTVDPFQEKLYPKPQHVAIFRDQYPWGYNVITSRLVSNGITYDLYGSAQFGLVSLASYDKVILPSNQPNTYYSRLTEPTVKSWIENYVSSGGIFQMHVGHYTNLYEIVGQLPGGYVDVEDVEHLNTRNTSYYEHPILEDVTDDGIDNWVDSSGGYMQNLTGEEDILIYTSASQNPVLFTRDYGAGLMIYTHLLIEWAVGHGYGDSSILLENMLLYSGFSFSPGNKTNTFTDNIDFKWRNINPDFGALNYSWEFSNTSDFSSILDQAYAIPETGDFTTITKSVMYSQGSYYWRIRVEYAPFISEWYPTVQFNLIENYAAPVLSSNQVSPTSGNQLQLYNFSVVYTDSDNNPPYSVNVTLNGVNYTMEKANVGDNDYTDGVVFYYTTYFQPGTVDFEFHCSDGKYQTSSASDTLTIVYSNTGAPSLSGASVSPTIGNNETMFSFTITYTDPDNNFPVAINVSINGSVHALSEANSTDVDATDGKLYYYNTTIATHGFYEHFFACWDGGFGNLTGNYSAPEVNPFAGTSDIKNVAIFQSNNPWNQNIIQTTLSSNNITYTIFSPTDLTNVSLYGFDKVIIPSMQSAGLYDALTSPTTVTWLESYVLAGGILEIHGATSSDTFGLPGGYDLDYWATNDISINSSFSDHPIVEGQTNSSLDGWGSSAHTRIQNIKNGDRIILHDSNLDPRLIISDMGLGQIVLTGLTVEYGAVNSGTKAQEFLENLLLYSGSQGHGVMLTGPSNDTTRFNDVFNFTWFPLEFTVDEGNYTWQISNSSDFSIILDQNSTIPIESGETSYPILLNYTTDSYYWRVRPTYGQLLGNWSSVYQLNIIKNDIAPLLSGNVTPATGDQSTLFDFQLNYTDSDDNPPYYVNITINGTEYNMSKKFPGDDDYTNGCIYNFSTFLGPADYSYYFNTSDGRFNSSTSNYTLTVTEASFFTPSLTNIDFSPTVGDNLTLFNFTVTFTDADNNLPTYINITINGSLYDMQEANASDVLTNDGKDYFFNTTFNIYGVYQFHINCSDPAFSNNTGIIAGPEVNPFDGTYNFTKISEVLVYKENDPWGGTPIEDVLNANGISYITRGDTSIGSIYSYYNYEKVIFASYQDYWFNDAINDDMADIDAYVWNGGILEIHGAQGGYSSHTWPSGITTAESETNDLKIHLANLYHPFLTGVNISNYSASPRYFSGTSFSGLDGSEQIIMEESATGNPVMIVKEYGQGLIIMTGISVENAYVNGNTELLENIILYGRRSATPIDPANNSIQFNGNVNFTWKSAGAGVGNFDYTLQIATDTGFTENFTEITGIADTPFLSNYSHPLTIPDRYYWRILPYFQGIPWEWSDYQYFDLVINNNAPTLTNASVDPPGGDPDTYFNFTVVYTDLDNNAPIIALVNVGIFDHTMSKVNSSDNDYTDGVVYYWYWKYGENNYSVFYEFSDGKTTVTTTPIDLEITTRAITLNSPQVDPPVGFSGDNFTFSVNYEDNFNALPDYINITINGSLYAMNEANASDTTTIDGKLYTYSTTSLLNFGKYEYEIQASVQSLYTTTGVLSGPEVNPFSGQSRISLIDPSNGTNEFNWNVEFTWDSLEVGVVTTQYTWQISTTNVFSGGDIIREITNIPETAGSTSITELMDIPSDTYYWRVKATYQSLSSNWSYTGTFTVEQNDAAPTLTSAQVDPTIGNLSQIFNFTVIYTDLDNNLPTYLNITINGTEYEMQEAFPIDINAADGKMYYFNTTFASNGYYWFQITCSDGRYTNTTSMINGPEVNPLAGYPPVTLSAPINGSSFAAGNITFTWASLEAPFGLVNYTWQASVSESFSSIELEVNNILEMPTTTSAEINVSLPTNLYYWRVKAVYEGFSGEWSLSRTIDIFRNDFAPILSNDQVNPQVGNEYMLYNISVTYSDADNNIPVFVNLTVDGINYTMTKSNSSDIDYTDGVIFHYTGYFSSGIHDYSFLCNDSTYIDTLGTQQFTLQPNVVEPWIGGTSVTPNIGGNTTLFEFTAVYYDSEGNLPHTINITINGSTYDMLEVNPGDLDVMDGKTYKYETTLSLFGTYIYTVSAFDWHFTNSTSSQTGPTVNPLIGYGATISTTSPSYGSVVNPGTIQFTWNSLEPSFGPITYKIEISDSNSFTNIITFHEGIPETPITTTFSVLIEGENFPRGGYYWRVIPVYLGVEGSPSNSGYFTLNVGNGGEPGFWEEWGLIIIIIGVIGAAIAVTAGIAASRKKVSKTSTIKQPTKQKTTPEYTQHKKKVLTGDLGKKKAANTRYQDVVGPKTAKEMEELQKIEQEVKPQVDVKTCVVHKGPIRGTNYACPNCHVFYCLKCAQSLSDQGEKCWSCGSDIELDDALKVKIPVRQIAQEKENKKFYCFKCAKYHVIEKPNFDLWHYCPDCHENMAFIKDCPSCGQPISLTKELYDKFKGKLMQCSNCKKNVVLD